MSPSDARGKIIEGLKQLVVNRQEDDALWKVLEAQVSQLKDAVSGARLPFLLAVTWSFVWASSIYAHDFGYNRSLIGYYEEALLSEECPCKSEKTIERYHPVLKKKDDAAHTEISKNKEDEAYKKSIKHLESVHTQCVQAITDTLSELRKQQVEGWVVGVPWIGIKTTVFDFGLIGNMGALLLLLWFHYASRRENHAIRSFVSNEDSQTHEGWVPYFAQYTIYAVNKSFSPLQYTYAYQAVAQRFVFLTSRRSWALLIPTCFLIALPLVMSGWNLYTDIRDFCIYPSLRDEVRPRFVIGCVLTCGVIWTCGLCLISQLKTNALLNGWHLACTEWGKQKETAAPAQSVPVDPNRQEAVANR